MKLRNLTGSQQKEVDRAVGQTHIDNLCEIIYDLDEQISKWRAVTGFDDPNDFDVWFKELSKKMDELGT